MSAPPPGAADRDRGRILYRDIGDYLTREDKLKFLRDKGSVAGIDDWREIAPDRHHDWLGQRDRTFETFYPMGSKQAKAGKADDAVFRLFSNGYKTGRDAYLYNFSRESCAENARRMVDDYRAALGELKEGKDLRDAVDRHSSHVRWDRELKNNLKRRKEVVFAPDNIWTTQYRPFVKQHCYVDYVLVNSKGRMDSMFPAADSGNRAIYVSGVGSTRPFSALMVDRMPDLHFVAFGQCFPRYRYRQPAAAQDALPGIAAKIERVDNISDVGVRAVRVRYADNTITKDDVFAYVYGVLHAPAYRERFANDLTKALPRVPFAPDFRAFADAGARLADLHLGYETGPEYPLDVIFAGEGEPEPDHFRLGTRRMRLDDDKTTHKTTLVVNDHIRLAGIPAEAHDYEVNGRTPLGWLIDRYRIARDKESGLVNDPNAWFADDPRGLAAAVRRVVHLSVETARLVAALPAPFDDDDQ